jgi:hypothetical protein
MGRREIHALLKWGTLKERDRLDDLGVDGSGILNWIFKKWDSWVWNGFIGLRIGTSGGLFSIR